MSSGAGLLPPTLLESAHQMSQNHQCPPKPLTPFSGRNLSGSFARFATVATPTPSPSPIPTTPAPSPAPAPASAPDARANTTVNATAPPAPAPANAGATSPADAIATFLESFQPAQMASVAASAAASAATAAVQAAATNKAETKDKDKDEDETPARPWTEGTHPAFEVDGLHPDELRLAALPWERRDALGTIVTAAIHEQLYVAADDFARDAQDAQLLDPLISPVLLPPRDCTPATATHTVSGVTHTKWRRANDTRGRGSGCRAKHNARASSKTFCCSDRG